MSTLSENIKLYRKKSGFTQKELADRLGIAPTSISAWEIGRNKPLMDNIEMMSNLFGIKKSVLLGEDMTNSSTISKTTPTIEVIPSTLQKVTHTTSQLEHQRQLIVLNTAETQLDAQERSRTQQNTVGNSKDTVDEPHIIYYTYDYYDQPASAGTGQYLNDVQVEQIQLPVDYKADFVVRIAGDSMKPDYHSGDYIFVKLSVDLTDGDIGVFYYEGNAYIKELRINKTGAYLHSLNPDYKDLPITTDTDFRTIGEVIGAYREEG